MFSPSWLAKQPKAGPGLYEDANRSIKGGITGNRDHKYARSEVLAKPGGEFGRREQSPGRKPGVNYVGLVDLSRMPIPPCSVPAIEQKFSAKR